MGRTELFFCFIFLSINYFLIFDFILFIFLYSRFSLVIYFIHSINSVYMSIPISQFIPPLLSPLVSMFDLYICVSIKLHFLKHVFETLPIIQTYCFFLSFLFFVSVFTYIANLLMHLNREARNMSLGKSPCISPPGTVPQAITHILRSKTSSDSPLSDKYHPKP